MDATDIEKIYSELLRLASDKEISYSQAQIKKMSEERLFEVYREYQAKELDSVNEVFTDMAIIKLEELLKSLSWISEKSNLAMKLQDRKVFKKDVKCIISYITPVLPFIGLMEGAIVIASEVIDNYANTKSNDDTHTNESSVTPETEKGD